MIFHSSAVNPFLFTSISNKNAETKMWSSNRIFCSSKLLRWGLRASRLMVARFRSPGENLASGLIYSEWVILYFSESSGRLNIGVVYLYLM